MDDKCCLKDTSLFDYVPDEFNINLLNQDIVTEDRLPQELQKKLSNKQKMFVPDDSAIFGTIDKL